MRFILKLLGLRESVKMNHPYFGWIRFMPSKSPAADYWEAELANPQGSENLTVIIPAGRSGPSDRQVDLCKRFLNDLDTLFARCEPVFRPRFEEWAQKPFPVNWKSDFSLVGIDLPQDGDEASPWSVCYFVDAANHYFSAYFENNQAKYCTVDG